MAPRSWAYNGVCGIVKEKSSSRATQVEVGKLIRLTSGVPYSDE